MAAAENSNDRSTAEILLSILEKHDDTAVLELLAPLHPVEIAEILEEIDPEHWSKILSLLPHELNAEVIAELETHWAHIVAKMLPAERVADIIGEMETDDATDFLQSVSEKDRQEILHQIDKKDVAEFGVLLGYPEDSAGGIMQTELVSVTPEKTVADAIAVIRKKSEDLVKIPVVYVVDKENKLLGLVEIQDLIIHSPTRSIHEILQPIKQKITPFMDQEVVALVFKRFNIMALPIVDEQERLLGQVLVDDIVDVLEAEASEDMLMMAGAEGHELVYSDRYFSIAMSRMVWLFATLAGSLLTGYLMWFFKGVIENTIALITFTPAVTAIGGSVGTQTATIVIRGIATGRIDRSDLFKTLIKELIVISFLSCACGTIMAGIAYMWHHNFIISYIVAISMFLAMSASTVFGTLMPMVFDRLNIDPAIAAGPFVTAANDVMGVIIYMSIATLLLQFI